MLALSDKRDLFRGRNWPARVLAWRALTGLTGAVEWQMGTRSIWNVSSLLYTLLDTYCTCTGAGKKGRLSLIIHRPSPTPAGIHSQGAKQDTQHQHALHGDMHKKFKSVRVYTRFLNFQEV
jgi:hypothetical protein